MSTLRLLNEFTFKGLVASKLQSENASVDVTVDEILIVLGTSQAYMSKHEDFQWDNYPEDTYVSIEDERRKVDDSKKRQEERKRMKEENKRNPK